MGIIIVGLGPGNGRHLTREAWELLLSAGEVYLRTAKHPAVADLPLTVVQHSFDHVYQSAPTFAEVYQEIVAQLLDLGREDEIIYAVPGHPFVGESTVTLLMEQAVASGIPVRIVPGLSFIEPVLTAVGVDALDGLQIVDALAISARLYPAINANAPLIIAQVYDRLVAADVKQSLSAIYPDEHPVFLVQRAGETDEEVSQLALYEIDRGDRSDHLTTLYVPPLPLASSLPELAETVAVLRSPDGCPWDIEQTPQSMRGGFLEEAYEVLDALDRGDMENLREELGDMLYHIVMQAQMASEGGDFNLSQIIAGIETKLKRRHPHVWGDWQVSSTADVLSNWELLKQQEKPSDEPASLLDDLLLTLPALALSQKIQDRVGKAGFDWPDIAGVYAKVQEEIGELRSAETDRERQSELGDLLFAVVNLARRYGLEAESALRGSNKRFEQRFRLVEDLLLEKGLDLDKMSLDEMNDLWEQAKVSLAKAAQQE